MFYVCDFHDFMNIGVKDTSDGSVEYYSMPQLSNFINRGIDIAGVSENGSITQLDDSSYMQYYRGDFLAPSKYNGLAVLDDLHMSRIKSLSGHLYTSISHFSHGNLKDAYWRFDPIVVWQYGKSTSDLGFMPFMYYVKVERLKTQFATFNILEPDNELSNIMVITNKSELCGEYTEIFTKQGYFLGADDMTVSNIVDVFKDSTYKIGDGRKECAFAMQRVFHNNDLYIRYANLNAPFSNVCTVDEFYKKITSGALAGVNVQITDSGFRYNGLDGCYNINVPLLRNVLGTEISQRSKDASVRNKLAGKGIAFVKENGVLAKIEVSSNGLFEIPDTCTTFSDKAFRYGAVNVDITKIVVPASCINLDGKLSDYRFGCLVYKLSRARVVSVECMSSNPKILRALLGAPDRLRNRVKFDLSKSNKMSVLQYLICYTDGINDTSTSLSYWKSILDLNLLTIEDFGQITKICYKKYLGSLSKLEKCEQAKDSAVRVKLLPDYARERVLHRLYNFLKLTENMWNSSKYIEFVYERLQRGCNCY